MKLIDVSTPKHPNTFCKVDDEDFPKVVGYKWNVDNHDGRFYVRRSYMDKGKVRTQRMHRVIMGNPKGFDIDHISGDCLDNQKANLRICTRGENSKNMRIRADKKTSKYKGVHFRKDDKFFVATITVNMKKIHLGSFKTEEEAALAYDKAAEKYHGDFSRTNGLSKLSALTPHKKMGEMTVEAIGQVIKAYCATMDDTLAKDVRGNDKQLIQEILRAEGFDVGDA